MSSHSHEHNVVAHHEHHAQSSHGAFLDRFRKNLRRETILFLSTLISILILVSTALFGAILFIIEFLKSVLLEYGILAASKPKEFFSMTMYFAVGVSMVLLYISYYTVI